MGCDILLTLHITEFHFYLPPVMCVLQSAQTRLSGCQTAALPPALQPPASLLKRQKAYK